MPDLISRQAAIDELVKMLGYCFQADEEVLDAVVTTVRELPSAQPKNENLKFLEFLWNTINPNEMEQYLEMYSSKEVKSNG